MNMGYCRFENTFKDLLECEAHFDDSDLSEIERKYRIELLKLCAKVANSYNEEDFEEV